MTDAIPIPDPDTHPSGKSETDQLYEEITGLPSPKREPPTPMVKPPLGITPRQVWMEQRADDLRAVIRRYNNAGKIVPRTWKSELTELEIKLGQPAEPFGGWVFPHMCKDGHEQIGHRNSESELCPLCTALQKPKVLGPRDSDRVVIERQKEQIQFWMEQVENLKQLLSFRTAERDLYSSNLTAIFRLANTQFDRAPKEPTLPSEDIGE
jgi:hypothetical protein